MVGHILFVLFPMRTNFDETMTLFLTNSINAPAGKLHFGGHIEQAIFETGGT